MSGKIMELEKIRELMQQGTPMEMGSELLQAFAQYAEEARHITSNIRLHRCGNFFLN